MLIKKPLLLIAIFYFFSTNSIASEQNFQLHGFISQGLIDVDGSNFVNDDGGLSAELTELGLNGSYQLSSTLRLTGQVVYLDGGNRYAKGVRIDYALLDWSVYDSDNWQANVYLGRFKNNHWLYSSTRDIPFARPSIILPQSVYFDGFRDIAVGSDGIAIKISRSDDDYGNFDFSLSYGTSPISDEQAEIVLSKLAQGKFKQEYDASASIYWQPAFSSWRFGLSLLDAAFSYRTNNNVDFFVDGDFYFQFYTINALYEGEKWEFSGEIHQNKFSTKGFYNPQFYSSPIWQGLYVQSRYKVNKKLTLLARYERFYNDKNDKDGKTLEESTGGLVPAYFGYHRDTTVGISYDFSSDISLRLEYHWFQGAARLTPVVLPNPRVNDSKNWQLWTAQLMYWF
ncbi:hypothetical protein [Candidatus Colwellia aromaticivorans]|uniref:hypothetical protein n=1 Tax=Candidatus Colwellia aromaticivorans TaxID=2267621 RepID=UPI001B34736A|nr:hypothetical protein [Candidatus Colwellia aromaticivorans]